MSLEYVCCYSKNCEQSSIVEVIFVLKKTNIQKYVIFSTGVERGKIAHLGIVTTQNPE